MDHATVIRALAALAQPVRLEVFRALVVCGARGMTPSTMAEGLDIARSSLSFHLKELTNAGLIVADRASRNLIYRADFDQMAEVLQYLTENCCQGEQCALDGAAGSCAAGADRASA